MVGEQKLEVHLARSCDLGRVGFDLHALGAGIYASGYHTPGSQCGTAHFSNLNKAETASADLVDVFQIAERGNINMRCFCGFQNRGTLGDRIVYAV